MISQKPALGAPVVVPLGSWANMNTPFAMLLSLVGQTNTSCLLCFVVMSDSDPGVPPSVEAAQAPTPLANRIFPIKRQSEGIIEVSKGKAAAQCDGITAQGATAVPLAREASPRCSVVSATSRWIHSTVW